MPTLDAFWPRYVEEYCEANRLKPSTIAQKKVVYDYYLKERLGPRTLDQVRDSEVAKLKAALKDLSPKTVNNVLVTLSTMLKAAKEWGVLSAVPCTFKLLKTTVPTVGFYEPPVYERLVEAARQIDPRIELLVLLGEKVTAVLLAKWMRRAQRRAGLKPTGALHVLRHTFCSRLAMQNAAALAIKELAGHTSLTTTMRYMHLSPAAKSAAIELLNREVLGDIKETAQGSTKNP
ncbi:tyrosine-type recombinase/integrase [Anaeromyxobacter sp. Red801]|uniref:tyrosine-type recombinase/integrase n=1 Tax=Anaeromyxobacter sp. Red801 TaxID=3411632 RepID=UPI003B9FB171